MYLKVSAPHGARAETLKQIQKHTQALPQSGTNSKCIEGMKAIAKVMVQYLFLISVATGGGFGPHACPSLLAKVLTTAGGGVVILWALIWPCVWILTRSDTQQHQRNFTPISCVAWLLSLVFVGIVCALAVQVYHDHTMVNITECIYPAAIIRNITEFKLVDTTCSSTFFQVPLWSLTAMGGMIVIFVLVSFVLCVCLPLAGRVW